VPTSSPSRAPTMAPTSSLPTTSPTTVPTTSQPTASPVASIPTSTPTTVPARPLSGNTGHACYADVTGVAKCWGEGTSGELGNGASTSSNTPVVVSGLTTVTSTCNGDAHACFLQSGRIHCTGSNAFGQIGNAQFTDGRLSFCYLVCHDVSLLPPLGCL
jgi:hypothetical protein